MTKVAVVAHSAKTLGGGLDELRRLLVEKGHGDAAWYEVNKSREASKAAARAVKEGAELIFIWGGDGTVQRCVNAVAGEKIHLAILPAGTANLLAVNLGVPIDLEGAIDGGLNGVPRTLDVGVINGKRFAVMAGIGLDAMMMRYADGKMKDRFGRLAYVWTGARATRLKSPNFTIKVDGKKWYKGKADCILFGQMGMVGKGITCFHDAKPDDGLLEVGIISASGPLEWAQVITRLAIGHPDNSPMKKVTQGREVDIKIDRKVPYELDGGARSSRRRVHVGIEPAAITVLTPRVEKK
jgi:diacylglycerol kinase (ATP)